MSDLSVHGHDLSGIERDTEDDREDIEVDQIAGPSARSTGDASTSRATEQTRTGYLGIPTYLIDGLIK